VRILGVTMALVLLSGCASAGEGTIIDSWRNTHIDEVIRHWGVPDHREPLADGTTLYQWDDFQTILVPGSITGTVGTASFHCTRVYIAGPDGIVLDGTARGDNCCVMTIAGHCASLLNPNR